MGSISSNTLEYVLNFRDVGRNINEFTGKKYTFLYEYIGVASSNTIHRLLRKGVLFRSARPDDASAADRDALRDEFELKTIMDLRTKSEHVKQAKKREADKKLAALQPDQKFAQDVQIPGIDYLKVNINGKGFERNLLWQLTWWQLIKLIVLMAFGYRMKAISILGTNVMLPRGLVGLGYDTLDHCQPELTNALTLLSQESTYPTLVHCTQGKDRTGIIVALLLFLLDVPIDAISYDYTMSEKELLPQREKMLGEIHEIGLSDEFAGCPKDWIYRVYGHINEKYGGIKPYLEHIGIGKDIQARIIEILQG